MKHCPFGFYQTHKKVKIVLSLQAIENPVAALMTTPLLLHPHSRTSVSCTLQRSSLSPRLRGIPCPVLPEHPPPSPTTIDRISFPFALNTSLLAR